VKRALLLSTLTADEHEQGEEQGADHEPVYGTTTRADQGSWRQRVK
jgi:hypothetical protein